MKYNIDVNVYELKRYYYDESAYFYGYENCSMTQNFLKLGLIYEEFLYNNYYRFLDETSIVIEGGSFIGDQTVFLSKISNKVYTFEPLKPTYDLLLKNLELNNCHNVETFNKGLSEKESTVLFHNIPSGNLGASCFSDNPLGELDINELDGNDQIFAETTTIDSLKLNKLDFIKLDIEGYEIKALKGGIETIKKNTPIILIESWSNHNGEYSIDYVKRNFNLLLDLGYSVQNCGGPNWLFRKI